jgi:hypothetical protein
MTNEQEPVDDGATPYEESIRPPGQSLPTADERKAAGHTGDFFDDDTTDVDQARDDRLRRAGYDPADVSGDTDAVRPQ